MSSKPGINPNAEAASSEVPAISYPLVGLGASAGGIQALQKFFETIPSDTGMAFVVVMHLSPNHESSLAEVLQAHTSMSVQQVTQRIAIAPNHVFVISPNKHLVLQDGHIDLVDPQQATGKRLAVDLFFRTLAAAFGTRAVAIVLSGSDSDGAIGIKHIKEQGGLTIAQEPTEAAFDSMPRSAISTGMVDWILSVTRMADQLVAFLRNEAQIRVPPEGPQSEADLQTVDRNSGGPLTIRTVASATDEEALVEVLQFLRIQTGHEFKHYKRATLLRRIARRLQVNLLETISAYLDFLRTHPAEAAALLQDLLISVTNFFRDESAFAALESQIPQLFADKSPTDHVRVWVTACATGEEAYSVAMLLTEYTARLDSPPSFQVFATDLDAGVVSVARTGLYPAAIEADVSQERLRRFFRKDERRYQITKELRERVLFSVHNLLGDSPFSRLDLVTCRNLLIYLKPEAQEAVLDLFHFALRPGGLLLLGSAENIPAGNGLFGPIDSMQRLFVRRTAPRPAWHIPTLATSSHLVRPPMHSIAPLPAVFGTASGRTNTADSLASDRRLASFGDLHLSLLEQFAPPSVVINSNYDIVHLSEHAMQYLQISGEPSLNLLRVVHSSLRTELRTALFRSAHQNIAVTTAPLRADVGAGPNLLTLHVRPTEGIESEQFFLIVFDPMRETDPGTAETTAAGDGRTRHLEDEIEHLRDQMRSTVEQYETSLEELKASNEEHQSINEEMRSTAEELETSKEELQSTNEELTTVNQELKSHMEELSRANADLQNLMASTDIGTIFLDRQLSVKRFTPRIRELFNLIPTDIGRPLSDITHKLNYLHFDSDALQVLESLHRSERELQSEGHTFLVRMLPYRTLEDRIDGVVLTFVDITERKEAEEALRLSEEQFRSAVENAPIPIVMHAEDGTVLQISRTWSEVTGYTADEMGNFHAWMNSAFSEGADTVRSYVQALFGGGSRSVSIDIPIRTKTGENRFWTFSVSAPGTLSDGRRVLIGMALDITERRRAEELQRALEQESARMEERNRLARELHDTLAQGFTGIKLLMDAAEADITEDPAAAHRHITRAREMAQESIVESRRSIRALRSLLLDGRSLSEAFQALTERANQGVQVSFSVEGRVRALSSEVEIDLYRIGQEALTNALRHSHARNVRIDLKYRESSLLLRISDDGHGFNAAAQTAGFGRMGMEERAARIHAALEVNSTPGQGTEVLVTAHIP